MCVGCGVVLCCAQCLVKDSAQRPDAITLLAHPFVATATNKEVLRPLFDPKALKPV